MEKVILMELGAEAFQMSFSEVIRGVSFGSGSGEAKLEILGLRVYEHLSRFESNFSGFDPLLSTEFSGQREEEWVLVFWWRAWE